MSISKKVSLISASPTLKISAKAKQMKSEGIDVISFGAGEPDFDTPANIKEAAKKALDEGFTKYTPASGTKELKEAICRKFKDDNGLDFSPGEIIISCGAKHSIFNAIMTLCNEGDEVILLSPYWVSYPEMIKVAGCKPVILKTTQRDNFKIKPEQLREAVTSRTKLVILNSPSNPTGMVYEKGELQLLSEIIADSGIYCISDEIYEKIIYEGEHVSIASFGPEVKKLTIVINGVSKSYSMTGWRIGYAAGSGDIVSAMSNLQSHSTSNPTSISQVAAVEALNGSQKKVVEMAATFKKRRDCMVEKLNEIQGVSCLRPQGAFYAFADISKILEKGTAAKDSVSFAEKLLGEANVAVVPGAAFGDDRCIRLSYATSMENIEKGIERVRRFVEKIL